MKQNKEIITDAQSKELKDEVGPFTPLPKRILEASLEGEVTDHVAQTCLEGKRRNGYGTKTLKIGAGYVDLRTPRDRSACKFWSHVSNNNRLWWMICANQ